MHSDVIRCQRKAVRAGRSLDNVRGVWRRPPRRDGVHRRIAATGSSAPTRRPAAVREPPVLYIDSTDGAAIGAAQEQLEPQRAQMGFRRGAAYPLSGDLHMCAV